MTAPNLPLPAEPRALQAMARALLDQTPEVGLPLVVAGDWIADPLWEQWGDALIGDGMTREQFGRIVGDYGNELRLWVVGERPWEQYANGLAGRVTRRLPAVAVEPTEREARSSWHVALERVGATPEDEMTALVTRIGALSLLYDIAPPGDRSALASATSAAIVWAGARPRDPEAPTGEGCADTAAAALAEALGRFLLKDPAYPPQPTMG